MQKHQTVQQALSETGQHFLHTDAGMEGMERVKSITVMLITLWRV